MPYRGGSQSNKPGPFVKPIQENFVVETPDGCHMTTLTDQFSAGPIDLGCYRVGPMAPAMHTGATNGPAMIGNKSGRGKTVTVK